MCHTTIPFGDWQLRSLYVTGASTPYPFTFNMSEYLQKQTRTPLAEKPESVPTQEVEALVKKLYENEIPARIAHLGIECEACHNGSKQHAQAESPGQTLPYFFPASPTIKAKLPKENPYGRTHDNVNWVCARCHHGGRPQFPGGINTWNSTEFTDAQHGGCYSQLRCIDCHDPHKRTGLAWSHTPDWEDGKCLKCHQDYRDASVRRVIATFRHALRDRIEDKLGHLDVPVLVVRGTRDPIVPQRWAEEAARRLPQGRLVVVRGAAHTMNFTSPDELARVVRPFVEWDRQGSITRRAG